ncbi:hypothetical protein [Slackia exigua]|uniref:hypothetical protein n=1 Tax=Slackia exigua TaxID=84109 RepID=UPI0028DB51BA|nr:hypothetical protein [Slackia exigua]
MTDTDMGQAMDWEGEVSDEGGFVLLEPGVYPFVVSNLEKERYEGGAKMGPCPRAKLTLSVFAPSGDATVFDRILLHTKTQWRVAQLFCGLGFEKNAETGRYPMAWNQVVGRGGYVELKVREYESRGEKYKSNDVVRYLPPAEWPAQDAAQPAQAVAATPIAGAATAPAQAAPEQSRMPLPPQTHMPNANPWSM